MPSKVAKTAGIVAFLLLALVSSYGLWRTYAGYDLSFPYLSSGKVKSSPVWDIGGLGKVRMLIENTQRYQIDTDDGAHEWENLVPSDGGIIYQRNPDTGALEERTISMFHQLRCLNVLRLELVRPSRFEEHAPNEPLVTHCLNYLRQMILCRSDLYLENVRDPVGPHAVDVTHVRTCKDWRKVYTRLPKVNAGAKNEVFRQ